MRLKTLRESLQPVISDLQDAADYWSEMTMRGKSGNEHYIKVVKLIEEVKMYVIEHERKEHEELRIPSGSDGGLHRRMDDGMADSGVERFG